MFKWKRAPSYQEEGKGTEKLTLICTRTVPGLLWTLRSRSCPVLEEKKPTVNEAQEPSSWGGDWHKPGGISTWGLILTLASQALWLMRERGKINQKSCWHLQRTDCQFVFHPHWKRNGPRFFMKLCCVGFLDPKHSHLLSFLENCMETSSVLGHWADIFRVLRLL